MPKRSLDEDPFLNNVKRICIEEIHTRKRSLACDDNNCKRMRLTINQEEEAFTKGYEQGKKDKESELEPIFGEILSKELERAFISIKDYYEEQFQIFLGAASTPIWIY